MSRRKINNEHVNEILKEVSSVNCGKAYERFVLYSRTRNKSEATLLNYENTLRRFFSFLTATKVKHIEDITLPIDVITLEAVEAFIFDMNARKLKPSTINSEITVINVFNNFLEKQYKKPNPTADIEKVKEENETLYTPSHEDIKLVLSGLDTTNFTDFRTMALIETIANSGLRCSELARLNVDDVSIGKRTLTVKKSKSRKFRTVPINDTLAKILSAWLEVRGELQTDAFFVTVSNTRMSTRSISMSIHNAGDFVGLEHFSPHSLRRYFITELINHNVPVPTITALVGHSSVKTIMSYYNLTEKSAKSAVSTIGRKKRR